MRTTSLLMLALAAVACSNAKLNDERHPTGSATMAPSSNFKQLYVANSDAGSVSVVDPDSGVLDAVDVGIEPVRLARAGDQVFVTTRGTGELVVLDEVDGTLQVRDRIQVGPDPYGVVASEDGTRVFVAVGLADQVLEIDAESHRILRRFDVPGQPRWVALHPSGSSLYAGSAFGGTWAHIRLDSELEGADPVTVHTPPERIRFDFEFEAEVPLTPRITGDLGVSPDGDFLVVPVFYVDNTTPVEGAEDGPAPNSGYASGPGVGRTNPSVLVVETDSDGDPSPEGERTLFAQAPRFVDSADSEVFDEFGDPNVLDARSYISSATVSPDALTVLVTMEGSETLITLPLEADSNRRDGRELDVAMDMPGGSGGFEFVQGVSVATDAGPRGVVFLKEDQAVVDTWLDRAVAQVPYGDARSILREGILRGDFFADPSESLSVTGGVQVVDQVLDPDVVEGRKLFYSATDSAMAAHSGGISCATCHYDGRNDGLTWTFAVGERQTPSLAGVVSQTTPVTWTNDVPSVATEVRLTSKERMGGTGASVSQSSMVEAYIDITPYPESRTDLDQDAVARGRDLFFGEAECSTCHNGAAYTDRKAYDMAGLQQVMTPTLRGIAATGPYLHDGRAQDLRELVEIAEDNQMGKTNHLSEQQKSDLALFLTTL